MKQKIYNVILLTFIIIESFILSVSFLDTILKETIFNNLIDIIYIIRNITLFLSVIIVFIEKKFKIDVLFLILFFITSFASTYVFFNENWTYCLEIIPHIKFIIGVYMIIRSGIIDLKLLISTFINSARYVLLIILSLFLIRMDNLSIGKLYMQFSNATMLLVCILIYSFSIKNNKFDLILSIFSIILLLLYGSRGGLLFLILYILYVCFLKFKNNKNFIYGLMILSGLVVITFIFKDNILLLLKNLGISSRTLENILNGNFFKSNERLQIYDYLLNILSENQLFGVGICGDRYYLPFQFSGVNATYAHNIILELFLNFGIPLGIIMISLFLSLLYRKFYKLENKEIKAFFAIFIFSSILQLFISRSWLTEYNLFLFIALLINTSNKSSTI